MLIKPKDVYRVESSISLDTQTIQVLMNLYQPLIGPNALITYLTLVSEAKTLRTQETHARLLTLLNLSSDEFDQAIGKLEEYMLVKTYRKEMDSKDSYVYVVNAPLSAKDFIHSSVYYARYQKVVGDKFAENTLALLLSGIVPKNDYKEITRKLKYRKTEADVQIPYTKVEPRYVFEESDEHIEFDYEKFLESTSQLIFPVELRNEENLKLIGQLATVHGLSVDAMRLLVSKATSLSTMELDQDKLRYLAQKEKPDITTAKDVYDLPPTSFLQSLQKGAPVSIPDQKILEHLSMEMGLSNPVINVLIEYILDISNNRLPSAFVNKVAGEWIRDGVTTKEEAIAETKKETFSSKTYTKKKETVPEYIDKAKKGDYKNQEKADQKTIDQVKKKIKKSS